ncbi:MAG: ATP-dependent Clp protease proteolytic subunit [Alphaproteobacteria bacterium]
MERDRFMSGEEAKAFGIVDDVVHERTPAPEDAA